MKEIQVGDRIINHGKHAGEMLIRRSDNRKFYCWKQATVIETGKLLGSTDHYYVVIDDKGFKSTIDSKDFERVTLEVVEKALLEEEKDILEK